MKPSLHRLFTHHPESVGESYGQHFSVALGYGLRLMAAGACALVHAILPFCFEKTASTMVRRMVADMDRRSAPSSPTTRSEAAGTAVAAP
jgi:hypothetical protein